MDFDARREGSVVHRYCSGNKTRPLLQEQERGLAGVLGGERYSKDIAAVIMWYGREKLGETRGIRCRDISAQSLTCVRVHFVEVVSTL